MTTKKEFPEVDWQGYLGRITGLQSFMEAYRQDEKIREWLDYCLQVYVTVDDARGCWVWQSHFRKDVPILRIPVVAWRYGMPLARILWCVRYEREIPEGMWIYRTCPTRLCVRPEHLAAFTPRKSILVGSTVKHRQGIEEHIFPAGHARAGELDAVRVWTKSPRAVPSYSGPRIHNPTTTSFDDLVFPRPTHLP